MIRLGLELINTYYILFAKRTDSEIRNDFKLVVVLR